MIDVIIQYPYLAFALALSVLVQIYGITSNLFKCIVAVYISRTCFDVDEIYEEDGGEESETKGAN